MSNQARLVMGQKLLISEGQMCFGHVLSQMIFPNGIKQVYVLRRSVSESLQSDPGNYAMLNMIK